MLHSIKIATPVAGSLQLTFREAMTALESNDVEIDASICDFSGGPGDVIMIVLHDAPGKTRAIGILAGIGIRVEADS